MLEFEKKILLTKDEFVFIKANIFANSQNIRQTNYYYDTDKLAMNRSGITCRIRETNGLYTAIIKDHSAKSDCSVETYGHLSTVYDDLIFSKMSLVCHGSLITDRLIIRMKHIDLMLDKNCYLDTIDYELEAEYSREFENEAFAEIEKIASALYFAGILTEAETFMRRIGKNGNKSERFFAKKFGTAIEKDKYE